MGVKHIAALVWLCLANCATCAKITFAHRQRSGPDGVTSSVDTAARLARHDECDRPAASEYYGHSAVRRRDDSAVAASDFLLISNAGDTGGAANQEQNADITPAAPGKAEVHLLDYGRDARAISGENPTTMQSRKKKESLMSRILPMLVMPFLVSSSLIPMMLTSLKVMLLKSLFVGKIAILLLALNAFWRSDNRGGVYSHNVSYDYPPQQKDLHMNHYGYNGDVEYGAYVNRRSARVLGFR